MEYQEEHLVEYHECDENSNIKFSSLVDLMMQTSEHQLEKGKAGTQALLKKGIGWVVTQYHFEIQRMPRALEKIILTTEGTGYNRFFEYRDFGVKDAQGRQLITVTSQWVMLDLDKRKLIPADQQMMREFSVPFLKKMPHFPRLRPLANYKYQERFKTRFYDLDTNHHLTNSHYFNWFVELLGREFMQKYQVRTIDLRFEQEVKYGDTPEVFLQLENTTTGINTYFAIKQNNKTQATCQMQWRCN